MADLIDRQAALNIRVSEGLYEDGVIFVPLRDVTEGIKALPPAQPKKEEGLWIDTNEKEEWYAEQYKCDQCGETMLGKSKYCPECGAKMLNAEEES